MCMDFELIFFIFGEKKKVKIAKVTFVEYFLIEWDL